jgi:hypothetical protein
MVQRLNTCSNDKFSLFFAISCVPLPLTSESKALGIFIKCYDRKMQFADLRMNVRVVLAVTAVAELGNQILGMVCY